MTMKGIILLTIVLLIPILNYGQSELGMINDPDGYTNMRSGPGAKNSIVTRVDAGDVILTRPQSGEWWKVSLMDRTEGYMHKSRIILLQKYPY